MVRPLARSGPGDRGGGDHRSPLKDGPRDSDPRLKSCVVVGSLVIFTLGSLMCVSFVQLFEVTDFQLLYSLVAVDDTDDPLPADGHWFVWAVMMLAVCTSIAGGFGYTGIRMGRRAVLCVFSPVCFALSITYALLCWHVQGAVGQLEQAMDAQVVEYCNATTEWAYTVKLGCTHLTEPSEDARDTIHASAEQTIEGCDECRKDLKSLQLLQKLHAVDACQILEHLCHHMLFEEVGPGRCLITRGGDGHVAPPVIRSGDIQVEGVDNDELLECCEQGCASVVGCAGFWFSDGHCVLVSPHQPLFQHTLKQYRIFCKGMTWDKLSVDSADMHYFLPVEPTIEKTDEERGLTCWRKGKPRMLATFDKISKLMLVICGLAFVILLSMSLCTCHYHFVLTQRKFPELRGRAPMTCCKMCGVLCEKARRKRRERESRKRDELLGLDYSSSEYSSDD